MWSLKTVLWLSIACGGMIGVCGIGAFVLSAPRPILSEAAAADLEGQGDIENGRTIFAAADCASCHASPGQGDRLRLGGGIAIASTFGTFRAPNISPDPVDGIGRWRTADLVNALISGVSPRHEHYYPVLPYTSYSGMNVDDVRDLMAYLRTLPPVSGRPPPHELSFPFNVRRLIGLWKLLFLDEGPITLDPTRDPAWNRGRYLVEAVAHCAECHSSRNILGAIRPRTRFAGGPDPEGVGFAPNVTPAGIAGWSEVDISELLKSGRTPDLRIVGSSMADVVVNTATLSESDRKAIAAFMKSLPPLPTPSP
jgi:mono/diheme cytochrome c family protein